MWCVNTGLGALQLRAEHWRKRTFKWIFRHFWSGFVWGTCAQRCRWAQLLHIISQNLGRTTEKHCCCFKELCVLQPLAFPPKYLAILCMLFPNSALISCLKLLHTVHFTVVPGKTLITTFWYNYFILGIGSQKHVIKLPSSLYQGHQVHNYSFIVFTILLLSTFLLLLQICRCAKVLSLLFFPPKICKIMWSNNFYLQQSIVQFTFSPERGRPDQYLQWLTEKYFIQPWKKMECGISL